MRNFVLNTLLVLISLVSLVACLEIGIRIYSSLFFPKLMVLDDTLGWRHARDAEKVLVNEDSERILVKQNVYGHRGRAYPADREVDAYRLLVLGDSFTEGVHVAENDLFTSILEEAHGAEVINAGVGGYGTVQEYLYLMSEGFSFSPDAIVLMFFKNDLRDNCASYYPGFGPRPYAIETTGAIDIVTTLDSAGFKKYILPAPFSIQLNKYSYLYNALNSRVYQRLFSTRLRQLKRQHNKQLDDCGQYRILFNLLRRIRHETSARGVDFFVGLIPSAKEARNHDRDSHQPILDFCERKNLQCLSFLNRMNKAIVAGEKPYFKRDIHWTRAGHRIAAEELSAVIPFQDMVAN